MSKVSRPFTGPRRLILIQSGKYDYAELDLSQSFQLVGVNGLGKTALISTLQYLYIDNQRDMRFGQHSADDSRKFYFKSDSSFILFECETSLGTVAQKERIASAAATLIKDGDVLVIDGGTTTLCLAAHLANRRVRILTNSLLIAHRIDRLRTAPGGAEVFLTGGFLYPGSGLLVGPQAVANIAGYHARLAFISVGGLDEHGSTNTNQLVVESERAMIRAAERTVVLADSTKWSRRDMVRACDWKEISVLVTDVSPVSVGGPDLTGRVEVLVAANAAKRNG